MNNRNRHMQYRKSIYRKRRIRTTVILSICAAVVVFVLFIIVGTALHNKVQEPDDDWDEFEETSQKTNSLSAAEVIHAYPLPLLEDGSAFLSRLAAISTEAGAVCINLNNEEGTLLYRSELADSLPNITVAPDASSLSNSLSNIEKNGFYTSGALYLPDFDQTNDLILEVELSLSSAIACEAIRTGVGDVLLIAPSFEEGDVEKLCLLADRIHATEPDAIIGLLISSNIIDAENRIAIIDRLNKHFNYLCVDTTDSGSEDELAYIEKRISDMQLDIMYYKMRVSLPRSLDGETQAKYIEIATRYNISSWQILP